MIIDFKEASLARLAIGKGRLNISPIFNRMAKASLQLRGQSDLQDALKFLDHKDLNLISKLFSYARSLINAWIFYVKLPPI